MVEVMAPRNTTHKKPILLRWVNYVDASFKIHNGSSEEYLGTLNKKPGGFLAASACKRDWCLLAQRKVIEPIGSYSTTLS